MARSNATQLGDSFRALAAIIDTHPELQDARAYPTTRVRAHIILHTREDVRSIATTLGLPTTDYSQGGITRTSCEITAGSVCADVHAGEPTVDEYLRRDSAEHGGPLRHDGWAPALPEWEDLTEDEAITELRRGEESRFFPVFKEDPAIFADCPRHGRVAVKADGVCDECGYDFSNPRPSFDNYKDVA